MYFAPKTTLPVAFINKNVEHVAMRVASVVEPELRTVELRHFIREKPAKSLYRKIEEVLNPILPRPLLHFKHGRKYTSASTSN